MKSLAPIGLLLAALLLAAPVAIAAPGDLDTTFGTGGKTRVGYGFGPDTGMGVARQADGKLVIAAITASDVTGQPSFTVLRYTAAGALDPTFGVAGTVRLEISGQQGFAYSVAVQADQKIVAAGSYYDGVSQQPLVARFNTDGTLDNTFNVTGYNIVTLPAGVSGPAYSVAVQPDAKIAVGGNVGLPSAVTNILAMRFLPNGALDPAFGTAGIALFDATPANASPVAIPGPAARLLGIQTIAGVHYMIATATVDASPNLLGFVVRIAPDGTKDATFGTSGVTMLDFLGTGGEPFSLFVDPVTQQIVVTGYVIDGVSNKYKLVVARLTSGGTLDPTFNGFAPGLAAFSLPGLDVAGGGAIVDPADGGIYAIGNTGVGDAPLVVRFTAGGALDTNFNGTGPGYALVGPGLPGIARDAVMTGPGKIFVTGTIVPTAGSTGDVLAAQLLANGALDPAFGTGGIALGDVSNYGSSFSSIARRTDGKLIAAGFAVDGTGKFLPAIARFNADGSPDTTFGPLGRRSYDFGPRSYYVSNVFAAAGNQIVVTGLAENGVGPSNRDYFAMRFNGDGTPDATFGAGGLVTVDIGVNTIDESRGGALAPSGKIVITGSFGDGVTQGSKVAVVRLNTDGSLDTSFNGTGKVIFEVTPLSPHFAAAAVVLADESVVVGGEVYAAGPRHYVAKITNAGVLDATFGTGGIYSGFLVESAAESFNNILVQADGKIVAAGMSSQEGPTQPLLVRLLANGTLDNSYGTGGIANSAQSASSAVFAAALQADGKIVTVGQEDGAVNDEDVSLRRFNTDGNPDASFGTGGVRVVNLGTTGDRAQAALIQPDTTLVVAGEITPGTAMVARFILAAASAGPPTSIVVTSGSGQSVLRGTPFALPIVATVRDATLQPVANVLVTFAAPASFFPTAAITTVTVLTDANGMASTTLTAGNLYGNYTVTASAAGVATPANFALTNLGAGIQPNTTQIGFGNSTINVPHNAPTVKITSIGNIPLTSIAISVSGVGFSISNNNCPLAPPTLAIGANCTFVVTFTPTTEGIRSGQVTITTNAFVSPTAILLSGNGVDLSNPLGDADNDGIPNGVEAVVNTNPLAKDNDVFGDARLFVMQQYRDFLNREGDTAGIEGWINLINNATYNRLQVIDAFLSSQEFAGFVAPVVRLYFATFLRVPDYAGLTFNAGLVRSGAVTVVQLADFFTASPEFQATYGALNDTQFVTLLYNNVLHRAPDVAGLNGWVNLIQGGYTRGQVLVGFSDSPEYQASSANQVFVTMMYAGMLRRTPEPVGFNGWVGFLDSAALTRTQVINGFFLSVEYHGRFLP
jgi:uncharacterized delta-60 repeat protein